MNIRITLSSLLTLVILHGPHAYAEITTVPPGLQPGEQYRLVFITKDTTTALSSQIEVYDAFVTAQANSSEALKSLETTWWVIGSTSSVSAKHHTNTDDSPPGLTGVPIFRLDGTIVANDYDDLWNGTIANPLYIAQDGTVLDTCCGAWTGTDTSGLGIPGDELGAADQYVVDGAPNGTSASWIQTNPYLASAPQFLYAISDVLTAPREVIVDLKPGSTLSCNGAIPIAILGSDSVDVGQVDPETLTFQGMAVRRKGSGVVACNLTDTNGDGYVDLLCHFENATSEGSLAGKQLDGTSIKGTDAICVL